MTIKAFILVSVIILVGSTALFGQSAVKKAHSVQTCHDGAKAIVWGWLQNREWFSDFGSCAERLESKPLQLGKTRGFIINGLGSGLCGATGNCPTWVVASYSKRWRIILDAGSVSRTVDVGKKGKSNYPDLSFRGRMGAGDHYLGKYKYNGDKYSLEFN